MSPNKVLPRVLLHIRSQTDTYLIYGIAVGQGESKYSTVLCRQLQQSVISLVQYLSECLAERQDIPIPTALRTVESVAQISGRSWSRG